MPIIHDYSQIQVSYPELGREKLGLTDAEVPPDREVSTAAPLTGGGDLSQDRTLSLPKAAPGVDGYLSGADFARFNGKQAALTFAAPLAQFSGSISIPAATSAVDGYLAAVDFATFMAKESALTFSAPLVRSSNTISIPAATSLVNGYLTSTDWSTFNAKLSSSRTISTTPPLTGGGDLSTNRTFALDLTASIAWTGSVGWFGASAQSQRTSGANLTNNVTAGGTDDTIANYTDLTTYANDAAAIRNDIYQLARKLKQINDGLRTYGLFT